MKRDVKAIAPDALRKLMLHDWPGNVRELENTIEYAVAMTQQDTITEEYVLPAKVFVPDELGSQDRSAGCDEVIKPLKDARDAFEREYLTQVLALTEGNVSHAAKLAGKYRADFYDLLKKHQLSVTEFKKTKPNFAS
jgi:two-component system response regulator GlrR